MYLNLLPKLLLRNVIRTLEKRSLSQITAIIFNENFMNAGAGKICHKTKKLESWPAQHKQYCMERRQQENSDTASTGSFGKIRILSEDTDGDTIRLALKTLLYEQDTDSVMLALNQCQNHKDLLEHISKYENCFQARHCIQSVILLWIFYDEIVLADILASGILDRTVNNLQPHLSTMNLSELSCCYLYLRKMDVPNTNLVMREMLLKALAKVDSCISPCIEPLPLAPLSRLLNAINTGKEFHTPTVCQNFLPHILPRIENCEDAEEARLLAICLLNLQPLICSETLESFKTKVRQLLADDIVNTQTPKTVLKILRLLNHPTWSVRNIQLIRDLLYVLKPSIAQLNEHDLRFACFIFDQHQEPAGLASALANTVETKLFKSPSPMLLDSFIIFAEPHKRENLAALFRQQLDTENLWHKPNAVDSFFKILRGLKISDIKTCDCYWNGVIDQLDKYPTDLTPIQFLRHCNRYMNFNNNLGGTYRNKSLEKKLSQLAMSAIEHDLSGRIPSHFARLASFVLGYGHTPFHWKKFPNVILSKIINMCEQFTAVDCLYISRGVQIALEMRFRHITPPTLNMQIATIESILASCAERHLSREERLQATELNLIVRTLGIRKPLKNSTVYRKALEKYRDLDYNDLSSRIIRDIVYNLNISNFLEPAILENMFTYIETNHKHVTAETVEKVLSCAYNLGYTPKRMEVLDYAALILLRDFECISGLSLVQACLALCFYKTIPEELINKVFCVKFIQRVEEEIQLCYSKATYPERVLNLIMQLNRTVCLDFPEAKVPWFQQNYVEAQLSKKRSIQSRFGDEVKKLLTSLLKSEEYYRCNHTTPYGYQIDFVIHFDKDKKPIAAPVETTMLDRITKVAILLLKLDSFCENDLTALRGPASLKIKHLEMMGYKVLHINEHEWYSKYMKKPGAKANYLQCLLQISN